MSEWVTVGSPVFDPGIPGFAKGLRHQSGAALVMTEWVEHDIKWAGLFWVKRMAHNSEHIAEQQYRIISSATRTALNRQFDYLFLDGPPPTAIRDYQRLRVYDWEDDNICVFDDKPMSWESCQRFCKYVWDRVGGGSPLELSNNGRMRTAASCGGMIYLPRGELVYQTKTTILHEIAHELNRFDQHGPDFVSRYIALCVRFLGMNARELEESARRYHVEFSNWDSGLLLT